LKEKKPPKQIKITNEAYEKLKKIGDEFYSMTDRINYLLGEQPKKKIDSIPYAVAQASILANMEETKFINRSEIMKKVPKQLIELGWDKVHPDFFEDLKSWRCPIKVFLDNVIKSLVTKDVIKKHSTDTNVLNYHLNDNYLILFIIPLHEYLMSANDYLATYKDESYSIRLALENIKPFDHVKQLVGSCRR
jgi:predicted CopG family antitoxin